MKPQDKVEFVETANIARSLKRLNGEPYDSARWRRAFYHAFLMECQSSAETQKKIREALDLL